MNPDADQMQFARLDGHHGSVLCFCIALYSSGVLYAEPRQIGMLLTFAAGA